MYEQDDGASKEQPTATGQFFTLVTAIKVEGRSNDIYLQSVVGMFINECERRNEADGTTSKKGLKSILRGN